MNDRQTVSPQLTTGERASFGAGPAGGIRNEQKLVETINRLQRGLLRLAFTFQGRHPAVDRRLKSLGNLVRTGNRTAELDQSIDETVNTIVSVTGSAGSVRPGEAISRLLGRLDHVRGHQQELNALRQRAELLADDGIDGFVRDCAAYINGVSTGTMAVARPDAGPGEMLEHFCDSVVWPDSLTPSLQDLKHQLTTASSRRELTAVVDQVAQLTTVALERSDAGTTGAPRLLSFRDLILELLQLLPIPDTLFGRTDAIRQTLDTAGTLIDLREAIKGIADLVADMKEQLRREIQQLADFLERVTRRLDDIEVHIDVSHALQTNSQHDCRRLNTVIEEQVNDIRNGIEGTGDLDRLKTCIESRLDRINESLSAYVETEDRRFIEAQGTLNALATEIRGLESETQQLRTDLVQQHERSLIDPLTQIPNRLGFEMRIDSDCARWQRHGGNLALAIIDVDRFKQINDRYGHAAGDKVLATVALQLQNHIRASDHISRYGGEEFLLILPETSLADAEAVVDKLRATIAKCRFHYQQIPVPVTVSCGVAEFRGDETVQTVFDRADTALLLAKRHGRNLCLSERASATMAVASN